MRPTHATIDLNAIAYYVSAIRAHVSQYTRMMAVVKADGYGHGMVAVARTALAAGADSLGVALAEEALTLRENGIYAPILVLGAPVMEDLDALVAEEVAVTAWLPNQILAINEAARRAQKVAEVHLKIDTGMSRLGASDDKSIFFAISAIEKAEHVRFAGAFTHFATADEADTDYYSSQRARFEQLLLSTRIPNHEDRPVIHAANSAATLHHPESHFDMVRVGYAMYGYDPGPAPLWDLVPAIRWTSRIVNLKTVNPGACVSYGATFTATRPTVVATIPVGYCDGYRRSIGNRGYAIVRGQRAPVVGRVCMDQTMLDVTDIAGVEMDDEVVLLGQMGAARITAADMAAWQGTIGYEVMCAMGKRVPRSYLGEVSDGTDE